jgi:hypothetical protein
MPKVHFKTIERVVRYGLTVAHDTSWLRVNALCGRVVACTDSNSTEQRHDVTCKFCLRLLMAARAARLARGGSNFDQHKRGDNR